MNHNLLLCHCKLFTNVNVNKGSIGGVDVAVVALRMLLMQLCKNIRLDELLTCRFFAMKSRQINKSMQRQVESCNDRQVEKQQATSRQVKNARCFELLIR